MRVLLTPGARPLADTSELARRLAGADGDVVELATSGVRNLRRPLSRAEVHALRSVLRGPVVGVLCAGSRVPGAGPWDDPHDRPANGGPLAFAVADHIGLGVPSPLRGPNDDTVGPRFPVLAGAYRPDVALVALADDGAGAAWAEPRVDPAAVVVAGVRDDLSLAPFESAVVRRHAIRVVSTELVPLTVLAAHMGLNVAAVVMTAGECEVATEAAELAAALMGPERSG